jgi:hypothetical protein
MSDWERIARSNGGTLVDSLAMDMRAYYEANRPVSLWEKLFGRRPYVESCVADDLMLGLLMIAHGVEP